MPQHVPPRIYRRVPFESAVRLKFDRFHGFVEQYCGNLSLGGMFINSAEPPPLGAEVTVEFELEDGFELIRGRGRVVWVHEPGEGGEAPGFGLRFLELTPGSRELIFRLVERRVREGDRVFDLEDKAPATAAGRLVHGAELGPQEHALEVRGLDDSGAAPPWERPAPRAGEGPAAAGGTGAAAAAGGEVVRYGRAAREAAEAEAAETEAAGAEAAGAETAAAGPVGAGPGEAAPAEAVLAESTPAESTQSPEGRLEGVPAEAEQVGAWRLAGASLVIADPADSPPAGGDDPAASFAGLVDDDEETIGGSSSAAASAGDRSVGGAAGDGDDGAPPSLAASDDEADDAGAQAWPPREWHEPTAETLAGSPSAAFAADPGAGGAAGGASVAAVERPAEPAAARWGELEPQGSAAEEPGSAAPPEDAGSGTAREPLPRTESGDRPVRPRRGVRLAAALAAGLAVVALGAFLLLRMGGAGADPAGPAGEPLAAAAAPTTAERGAAAPPDAGGAPEAEAAPGAPAAAADPDAAASADASAAGPGSIERIAWQRRDGGVDFEIDGGGPIAPSLVDHFTLGGERPRLVVRIAGVERPYTRGDLAVGGPLVERVRTGFHPAAAGAAGELRIVFDLTAPAAAAAVDVAGGRVRVRFEER